MATYFETPTQIKRPDCRAWFSGRTVLLDRYREKHNQARKRLNKKENRPPLKMA